MTQTIDERLSALGVVPIIMAEDPAVALRTAQALISGGLDVLEVVLRTEAGLDCVRLLSDECPGALVGAGTVLDEQQARQAVAAGAQFLVSPGLDEATVQFAQAQQLPLYPGVATASEIQRARNLGLAVTKLFPANVAGGVAAIQAFSSVFRGMRFMPTGGVSPANLAQYLALPAVLACGGSWLAPPKLVEAGDFDAIARLASEALAIARAARAGMD